MKQLKMDFSLQIKYHKQLRLFKETDKMVLQTKNLLVQKTKQSIHLQEIPLNLLHRVKPPLKPNLHPRLREAKEI